MMTAPLPGTLARFQDGFAQALLDDSPSTNAEIAALKAQPAFTVYRNTVMKGCVDALQANYPAVTRLVGEEWMRAAAVIYVREVLPQRPMLIDYGAGFADFLARFEPAAELSYLPGVARLDRCWTEIHTAHDEPLLDSAAIATLAASNFYRARLQPRAAARWAWFAEAPVFTIWSRNRSEEPVDTEIEWQPEGALLTRPHGAVQWVALDRAGCAFLDACAAGDTITAAVQAALQVQQDTDIARLMTTLLDAGVFTRLHTDSPPLTEQAK